MARADAASASLRSDSIKGLAQSIANPAYRRLLTAEPLLRRAVPVLIIAFMVTICIGAAVQVLEHRRQVVFDGDPDHRGACRSFRRRARSPAARRHASAAHLRSAPASVAGVGSGRRPARPDRRWRRHDRRRLPNEPQLLGRQILDVLGPSQPLTTFGAAAGTMEIALPDGEIAFATVRALKNSRRPPRRHSKPQGRAGRLAIDHRADGDLVGDDRLRGADPRLRLPLAGDAGARSRPYSRHCERAGSTPRSIAAAAGYGTGTWRAAACSGRIRCTTFSACRRRTTSSPSARSMRSFIRTTSICIELATQLADAKMQAIDHAFRMRHADGKWLWLRVRCELARQDGEAGPHLIGIAVDISEQKSLVERTTAADLRLRDAIETIPEAFVLWDAENRLVLCNSNFQNCITCPTRPLPRAPASRRSLPPGKTPIIRTAAANDGRSSRAARAPSKRSSTTGAGCISASAAPRTAAMCRSAPTSPSSSSTSRS